MTTVRERNQKILRMRQNGITPKELARRFKLSTTSINMIERTAAIDKSMAECRAKFLEEIRTANDPEKLWPVSELADALALIVVTKKRLLDHFKQTGQSEISLEALMGMFVKVPEEQGIYSFIPLLKVYGIGKKGFRSMVNGLTSMDMGPRCNEQWRKTLVEILRNW
jgi:hypothetical protein